MPLLTRFARVLKLAPICFIAMFIFASCSDHDQDATGTSPLPVKNGDQFAGGEYSDFLEMLVDGSVNSIEYTNVVHPESPGYKEGQQYLYDWRIDTTGYFYNYDLYELIENLSKDGETWYQYTAFDFTKKAHRWLRYKFTRESDNTVTVSVYACPHPPGQEPDENKYPEFGWGQQPIGYLLMVKGGVLYKYEGRPNSYTEASDFNYIYSDFEYNDYHNNAFKKVSDDIIEIHFGDNIPYPNHITDLKITRK